MVTKHSKDSRPESYRPDIGSIKIIGELSTKNDPLRMIHIGKIEKK